MRNKRWWAILVSLLLIGLPVNFSVSGQEVIQISGDTVSIRYPYSVTFELTAQSANPIREVRLFWQAGPEEAFNAQLVSFQAGDRIVLSFPLNTQFLGLPPFAQVTYRWQIRDEGGNELTTANQTFEYIDTQHDWQELTNERIRLLWYALEPEFAQDLFQIADDAYLRLAVDFGVELERLPVVLIYPEQQTFVEFQRFMNNLEFVVGRYFPGHNITVNLVAENMPRELYVDTIAHELSHLYSDNFYGGYARLPLWLEEGLATYNEGEVLAEELSEVRLAAATGRLIPFIELPEAIRAEDIQVSTLAYAEGASIFKFIADSWGKEAFAPFLSEFRQTTNFNEVTLDQFNLTMVEFELLWRKWLGYPVESVPQLFPSPTLFPLIFPTPTFMAPGG